MAAANSLIFLTNERYWPIFEIW